MAETDKRSLLDLPAEIRNNIYKQALGGGIYRLRPGDDGDIVAGHTSPHPFSLLLVCSQVYREARLLPYSTNIITFDKLNLNSTNAFLSTNELRMIRHIRLETFWFMSMSAEGLEVSNPDVWFEIPPAFVASLSGVKAIEILGMKGHPAMELYDRLEGLSMRIHLLLQHGPHCSFKTICYNAVQAAWPAARVASRTVRGIVEAE